MRGLALLVLVEDHQILYVTKVLDKLLLLLLHTQLQLINRHNGMLFGCPWNHTLTKMENISWRTLPIIYTTCKIIVSISNRKSLLVMEYNISYPIVPKYFRIFLPTCQCESFGDSMNLEIKLTTYIMCMAQWQWGTWDYQSISLIELDLHWVPHPLCWDSSLLQLELVLVYNWSSWTSLADPWHTMPEIQKFLNLIEELQHQGNISLAPNQPFYGLFKLVHWNISCEHINKQSRFDLAYLPLYTIWAHCCFCWLRIDQIQINPTIPSSESLLKHIQSFLQSIDFIFMSFYHISLVASHILLLDTIQKCWLDIDLINFPHVLHCYG